MQFSIHRFDSVDSTNTIAMRMAMEGAPEGTVVIAAEQTAGRGRHGRTWISPMGEGIYLSLVLRPSVSEEMFWQIGFVMAVATAHAVRAVSGLEARLKWPNDVLLGGKKVGGVLIESASGGCGVVVGIGLNVNTMEFPGRLATSATSLWVETGDFILLSVVEDSLLRELENWWERFSENGFTPVYNEWKRLDSTVGRHVRVETSEGVIEGHALEIGLDGSLILRFMDGTTTVVYAGSVLG